MKTTEMETVIHRLQELPEGTKEVIAPNLNEYLNKLEDLRNTLQSSKNSGTPVALSKGGLLQFIHQKNAPSK